MHRIATTQKTYYRTKPTQADFEKHNAYLIISNVISSYFINSMNEVKIVSTHNIDELARQHRIPTIKTALCSYFDSLPEEFWQTIKQRFNINNNTKLKRLATFNSWVADIPKKHHFESHDAHIIVDGILTLHYICEQTNEVQTLYTSEFDRLALEHNVNTIDNVLYKHFDSLPDHSWQIIKQNLHQFV